MAGKCCFTCDNWRYDHWTEDRYGMGVGLCKLDGQARFCDHSGCPFHSEE